jgi:hypothetical protein
MADDSYLAMSEIAMDESMINRVTACATQQARLGNAPDIVSASSFGLGVKDWAKNNQFVWAASPGWGAAWASAQAGGNEAPGKDPAVITDAMILSAVQDLVS